MKRSTYKTYINKSYSLIIYDNKFRSGEIRLWRAVITQALEDCRSLAKRSETRLAKLDAIRWFNLSNQDFITVCVLAEVIPEKIIALSEIIKRYGKHSKKHRRSLSKMKDIYDYYQSIDISQKNTIKQRNQHVQDSDRKKA